MTKLQLQHPGQRLLIKNPVYTARVGLLRVLFPNAKFVHIYRNPYIVFQSMKNFYHTLLAEKNPGATARASCTIKTDRKGDQPLVKSG